MYKFNTGDKVRFLNEKGGGVITKITREFVYVNIDGNFEVPVLHSDIIVIEKAVVLPETDKQQATREEKFKVPEKEKTEEPVRKKNLSGREKGVFLLFIPVNQDIPIAGDLYIYLLNSLHSEFLFSACFFGKDKNKPMYKGEITPASANLIDTISRTDLADFQHGIIQLMSVSVTPKGLPYPIVAKSEIKAGKFLKEEHYLYNAFLRQKAFTMKLADENSFSYISRISEVDISNEEAVVVKAEPLEKQVLIDKFRTSHGEAEVDLHIEKIEVKKPLYENKSALEVQLDFFTKCLNSAIENAYTKVVFIHGVGVGILKLEMSKILSGFSNIEFRDAPIAKYGIGATEVIIRKTKE